MVKTPDRNLVLGAKKVIDQFVDAGFLDHGEQWIKAWYRHDLRLSDTSPAYVTLPVGADKDLVKEATEQPEAFDLAKYVISSRQQAGVELPQALQNFDAGLASRQYKRPPGSAGRKKNWGRDFIIINVAEYLSQGDPSSDEPGRLTYANRDQRGVRNREPSISEILHHTLPLTAVKGLSLKTIQNVLGHAEKRGDEREAWSMYLAGLLDDLDELERI